jgi:alkaline phosphatase
MRPPFRVSVFAQSAVFGLTVSCGSLDRPDATTGNVVFVHPDGTGLNHWSAARMYWQGPDGVLEWDRLPEMAVYRGHMADQVTATSNGGATTHAFGVKVRGPGSFGKDGTSTIRALSGYEGSVMREAANAGHPVGIVNDGDVAEPGTGAFLAQVDDRYNGTEIVRQMLHGRPDTRDEEPVVIFGGGERFFLPAGTPRCIEQVRLDCAVHADPVDGGGPNRTDGRNLLDEAVAAEWLVVRTREEFETLRTALAEDTEFAPKVLGLFAADDIFNDVPEEQLIRLGLVDDTRAAEDRRGRLIIWGDRVGTLGYDPPTAAEMTEVALTVLERHSRERRSPFLLVVEVESTDNMPNANNAVGALRALGRSDDVIAVARQFQDTHPATLVLTAADSDASGLQVLAPPPLDRNGKVSGISGNPTGRPDERIVHLLDGVEGRHSSPFSALPDAVGRALPFAIAWSGAEDVAGGVLARAQGLNAPLLRSLFSERFDNTDVYRMMYLTLFGELLPASGSIERQTVN